MCTNKSPFEQGELTELTNCTFGQTHAIGLTNAPAKAAHAAYLDWLEQTNREVTCFKWWADPPHCSLLNTICELLFPHAAD